MWECRRVHVHVALLIQHARRTRNIVTLFVVPRSPPHFSTISRKRCDFRGNVFGHKICVLIFFTTFSEASPILRIIKRDIVKNIETSSRKVPVFLFGF